MTHSATSAQGDSGAQAAPHSAWFQPCLHSAYYQFVSGRLSQMQGVPQREFTGQPRLLPLLDFLPIFEATQALTQPDMGIDIGMSVPPSAHGPVGMAALSCGSAWDVMQLLAKYNPIRSRVFRMAAHRVNDFAVLSYATHIPLGHYERFLHNVNVFAMLNIFRAILGPDGFKKMQVAFPRPASEALQGQAQALQISVAFNAPELRIELPWSVAERSALTPDIDMQRLLCQSADQELAKLTGSVAAKVRHLLQSAQPDWPTLDALAIEMGYSRRTLARKLESEGSSYQTLRDEARFEMACWYLRHTPLSLGHISEKIGFGLQTNFTRGFTRWMKETPTDYRNRYCSAGLN